MKRIADVSKILSGGTPRKNIPEHWGGTIPWFSAANMHEKYLEKSDINLTEEGLKNGSRIAPKGATLLLVRGSGLFNRIPICFAKADIAFNQDVKAFVPDQHTDPLFFHYWFESMRPVLSENLGVTGIGAGKFDTDFLLELPFPDLPRSDQEEIGRVAALCDQKIELNRRMAATLEEMARALYRSWFVDFDPVKTKAEGLPPAFMDEATAALFPDRFGDDGLPEGWELTTIGAVANIVGGATPSTAVPEYWDEGSHAWATPKDLAGMSDAFLIETSRQITDQGLAKIGSGLSPAGSMLLSSRAPIGYRAITRIPVAVNQGFIVIRETSTITGIEAYLWSEVHMETILSNANGSTFQEISKKNFRPIPYVLADEPVRRSFDDLVKPMFERLAVLSMENRDLANLRDTLLPKLMSGELRVGEAREQVEDAA